MRQSIEAAVRVAIQRSVYTEDGVRRVFDAASLPRRRRALGIKFPLALAVSYKRWLEKYIGELLEVAEKWVENTLTPVYDLHRLGFDDSAEFAIADGAGDIKTALQGLLKQFGSVAGDEAINTYVNSLSKNVLDYTKTSWRRSIRTITKLDPLIRDLPLRNIMDAHTQANVALIKTIPPKLFNEIERVTWDAARQGKLTRNLVSDLEETIAKMKPGDFRRSKQAPNAELIATDQLGKFAGDLARENFVQSGLKTYVWRTMKDTRVRGNPAGRYPKVKYSHWDREGKVYSWEADPPDGIPGFTFRCRCFAAINEDELLEREGAPKAGQMYDNPPAKTDPNSFGSWYRLNHTDLSKNYGKPMQNGARNVKELFGDAEGLEIPYKKIIDTAANAADGEAFYGPSGKEWLKTLDSLTDKVHNRGKDLAEISDSIRSTILVDSLDDVATATKRAVAEIERAGGRMIEIDDLFANPRDEGYIGLHMNFGMKTPEGRWVRAELQIHTYEDLEVKEAAHILYERMRGVEHILKKELTQSSAQLYGPTYRALMDMSGVQNAAKEAAAKAARKAFEKTAKAAAERAAKVKAAKKAAEKKAAKKAAEKKAAEEAAKKTVIKETEFERTLRLREAEIRGMKVEHMSAYDRKGELIFSKKGYVDRIEFTTWEVRDMQKLGKTLTHNHPLGGSFSPADIQLARDTGLKEIRAITSTHNHRMLINQARGALPEKKAWERLIRRERDLVHMETSRAIRAGKLTPKEADLNHWHTVWERISERFPALTYTRTPI